MGRIVLLSPCPEERAKCAKGRIEVLAAPNGVGGSLAVLEGVPTGPPPAGLSPGSGRLQPGTVLPDGLAKPLEPLGGEPPPEHPV